MIGLLVFLYVAFASSAARGQVSSVAWKFGDIPCDLQSRLKVANAISTKRLAGTHHVSPSGKYLAYVEERQLTPNFQPEPHLWGKDIQSEEEKELFVAPAPNPPTSPEPNVVLTVLGWAN